MIDLLVEALPSYLTADGAASREQILSPWIAEHGWDEIVAHSVAGLMARIAEEIVIPEKSLKDVEATGITAKMDEQSRETFVGLIEKLQPARDALNQAYWRGLATQGLAPRLVEFVGNVEGQVLWTDDQPAEIVPVATMQLGFDSGTPDSMTFQVSEPSLDRLMEVLSTLKGRMVQVREKFGHEESS